MARLSRFRLVSVGHPKARFNDLTLRFGEDGRPPTDSTIWLRNGGGKSSLLNLFFALVRPGKLKFLGKTKEGKPRVLEDYVQRDDRSVVVCEWIVAGPESSATRLTTGVFYERRQGPTGATELQRFYFAARAEAPELSVDGIPLFVESQAGRRRRSLSAFKAEWRALRAAHPHAAVDWSDDDLGGWQRSLDALGIDARLFGYQVEMNRREGGAADLFKFEDPEKFLEFLLELVVDPALGDTAARNIDTYRRDLLDRKEQILPELELVNRLDAEMRPLVDVSRERAAALADVALIAHELSCVASWANAELGTLQGRIDTLTEAIRDHEENAITANANAVLARRHAAALRVRAATVRLETTQSDVEDLRKQLEVAAHTKDLWDAAVPLRNALLAEHRAAEHERELERRNQQLAPERDELVAVATELRTALTQAIVALQATLREHSDRATSRAERALACRHDIARSSSDLGGATREIGHLEEKIEAVELERLALVREGIMHPEETGAAALARWEAERASCQASIDSLRGELERARAAADGVRDELLAAHGDVTAARAARDAAREDLDAATAARTAIEADPLLRRVLEVEVVDVERMPDAALEQLRATLDQAADRIIELRVERAADDHAIAHLQRTSVLPPVRDVERLLQAVRAAVPTSWSGWAYLQNNCRSAAEARATLERAPHLALAIVVRDQDLDRAVDVARASGPRDLDGPVMLIAQSSALEPAGRGVVIGPSSDAHFDVAAGGRELVSRLNRRGDVDRQLDDSDARRRDVGELLARFRSFRERWPYGWFARQDDLVDRLERSVRQAEARKDSAEKRGDELAQRTTELEALLRARNAADQTAARGSLLTGGYVRSFESERLRWSDALAAARVRAATLQDEISKLEIEAKAADDDAGLAREEAKRADVSARLLEAEHAEVAYGDTTVTDAPLPRSLAELRDAYRRRREVFEGQLGEGGLLALARKERELAADARRTLSTQHPRLDETQIVGELGLLLPRDDVDHRRAEAVRAHLTTLGQVGNATTRATVAENALNDAAGAASRLGEPYGLPPEEIGLDATAAIELATGVERDADGHLAAGNLATTEAQRSRAAKLVAEGTVSSLEAMVARYDSMRDMFSEVIDTVAPSRDSAPSPPQSTDDLARRLDNAHRELKRLKTKLGSLDKDRNAITSRVREWTAEPRYAGLKSGLARRFVQSDAVLEARAEAFCGELDLRRTHLDAKLKEYDANRELLIDSMMIAVDEAFTLIDAAERSSRLPDEVPVLGGSHFLEIETSKPREAFERRLKIGEYLDKIVKPEGEIPSGLKLVQDAVRRLATPVKARVLNPDPIADREYVDIVEMARFSGGEQLTGAILLYCTLAQLRARQRGQGRRPTSVLILDNPIGVASRVKFLALQREVARAMGIQLIYTTHVTDMEALNALPNVIRLRNDRVDRRTGRRIVEGGDAGVTAVRIERTE